jgi:hypothetical protein
LSSNKESLLAEQLVWILPASEGQFGASFMKIFVILRNEESLPIEQLVWIIPASE